MPPTAPAHSSNFKPPDSKQARFKPSSFRRSDLKKYLNPYWHWALLAPLAMALEVTMDLMQPRLTQRIVDQGIARADLPFVQHTALLMLACALIGLVGGIGCSVFSTLAGLGFGADLRQALFVKVQSLSFANLDELETGALITRLTNDVTQVQDMVILSLRVMVRVPLLLIGSLILAILTSPQLSLLYLPLIPFVTGVLLWIIRRTYPLYGEVQHRLDVINTVLQENLSGVRVVKGFARAGHEVERFGAANDLLRRNSTVAAQFGAVTMPLTMLALNAGVVAALWYGGQRVMAGTFAVGKLIAFISYLTQTLMALMAITMLIVRLSRAEASAQRIGEVLSSQPQIQSASDAIPNFVPNFRAHGRVAFENVSFRYHDRDAEPILQDISFVVEPGQTVAILGATGAGKSSLVNLIPRFYDVTAGRVTLDGIDVRAIDEDALRASIGIALQEAILFTGTIRDNIRYGRPDASDDEVEAAARTAQADAFIRQLPDGYDTLVGQRGVNLSGGQKQRIAIARALILKPALLILDDSTSAVDVRTEAQIQGALAIESAGQTRIVVAQRISAARHADHILVLEGGRLAAQGTHADLLATSPIYREIYESQVESGVEGP
jgi:ATP-binding cassette, subfamily B, multidrug efflux pump